MQRTAILTALLALAVSVLTFIDPSPAKADIIRTITNVGTGWELSTNDADKPQRPVYTAHPSDSEYHEWYIQDGVGTIHNNESRWCLSSNWGTGSSGKVFTTACTGSPYHKWRRVTGTVPGGYFQIISNETGWCLSSNRGNGSLGDVYTVPCSGSVYHNWRLS
ncbi:ricin-type beta-trefoil lectin domain protein [Actinoplanes sp. NPDC023801]|uniref:RICIN domain-containing protein n=1 Tax=Actinoplanes sp. NPDC023801 TaxID=3154595 RepID=UPI0033C62060